MDRLFVPLTKESFNDFLRGKEYEIRAMRRQWTKKNVRTGRRVTLSLGYSGDRINGIIGKVFTGSLKSIFRRILLKKAEPRARSRAEAVEMNKKILGAAIKYIAFEIKFRK